MTVKRTFNTISSPKLVRICIDLTMPFRPRTALDVTLTQLTAPKEFDIVLARPQLSQLRQVEMKCNLYETSGSFPIFTGISDLSSMTASHLPADLSSQTTPSVDVSEYREIAQEAIKSKIRDQLKRFNSRGMLDISIKFW